MPKLSTVFLALGVALFVGGAFSQGSRAQAAERKYATIVALGSGSPVNSAHGRYSPVLLFDHEGGDHYGDGTLRVLFQTAVLHVGMSHPLLDWLQLEYKGRLAFRVEGAPYSIFVEGRWEKDSTFQGHSAAAILAGRFLSEADWGIDIEREVRGPRFQSNEDTAAGFDLPDDFQMREWRMRGIGRRLFGLDEAEASLSIESGRRTNWGDWELDPDADDKARYSRQIAKLKMTLPWSGESQTKVDFRAGTGTNLDLFSSYWVGGIYGMNPVGGYFRQEFRAESMMLLNLRHDLIFSEDRILYIHGDAAWLKEIDLPIWADTPKSRTIGSVGLGYFYGIRSLRGLPLILRYAEGLVIPENSPESYRREISVVLAAGF